MKHTIIAIALGLLVSSPAAAQSRTEAAADGKWQPWLGCWQLLGETVTGERALSAEQVVGGNLAPSRRSNTGTRVCVTPAERGATITTMVGTERALEETIIADGSAQALQDAQCRGSRRSEWSQNASRLYSSADISCADQSPRKISSLSMMTPGPTWVDIQVIDISGRKNIRIRRYERVAEPGQRRAAVAGETSWSVGDVKEASAKLAPETVQAALVELKVGFNIKGKQLLELDRAGVPDSIVDLMVALSYPERFTVDRPVSASSGFGYGYGGYDAFDMMWPFYLDSLYWSSYYSPFAYRYWGAYDPYYFPGSGYVIVNPPAPNPEPSGTGRVVDGRGYTRVTTRTPEPVQVNGSGGGNNGTSSAGGSSSGGSSGVSSGGYSSGGGGGGGRTAVPRPPG